MRWSSDVLRDIYFLWCPIFLFRGKHFVRCVTPNLPKHSKQSHWKINSTLALRSPFSSRIICYTPSVMLPSIVHVLNLKKSPRFVICDKLRDFFTRSAQLRRTRAEHSVCLNQFGAFDAFIRMIKILPKTHQPPCTAYPRERAAHLFTVPRHNRTKKCLSISVCLFVYLTNVHERLARELNVSVFFVFRLGCKSTHTTCAYFILTTPNPPAYSHIRTQTFRCDVPGAWLEDNSILFSFTSQFFCIFCVIVEN